MNILRTKMSLNTEQVLREKYVVKGKRFLPPFILPSFPPGQKKRETVAWKIWGKIIMNPHSALQRSV